MGDMPALARYPIPIYLPSGKGLAFSAVPKTLRTSAMQTRFWQFRVNFGVQKTILTQIWQFRARGLSQQIAFPFIYQQNICSKTGHSQTNPIICIKKVLLSIKTFVSMNSSRDIIPNSEIRYFESWSMSQLERAAICSG
jgi:hypothetical protein